MNNNLNQNRQQHLGPVVFILFIVALTIWLINGSSHQPHQPPDKNWRGSWQTETSFNLARRAPAAAAYNGYLYIIGGIDGNDHYVTTVEFAPILGDGSLGAWQHTSPLIEGRFYNTAIAINGYIYAIGGGSGLRGKDNFPIASIERARINQDGSLGSWQTHSHLNTPRRGLKTIVHNNTVYAIGGYNGQFLKSVERSSIKPDGSLSQWQTEQHNSIINRYIHSAAAHNDTIYLLGGHMRAPNQTSYSDVERADINTDHHLGQWQLTNHGLNTSRLVAEAFTLADYLYIAGGHSGGERLASVELSRISANGSISPWRTTSALPTPLSAYAIATYNNRVYALGGAGQTGPLNTAYSATQNRNGHLGHWLNSK